MPKIDRTFKCWKCSGEVPALKRRCPHCGAALAPTIPKVEVTAALHVEIRLMAAEQNTTMKALMQRVWDEWKGQQRNSDKGDES